MNDFADDKVDDFTDDDFNNDDIFDTEAECDNMTDNHKYDVSVMNVNILNLDQAVFTNTPTHNLNSISTPLITSQRTHRVTFNLTNLNSAIPTCIDFVLFKAVKVKVLIKRQTLINVIDYNQLKLDYINYIKEMKLKSLSE
jgi:hypothetical protein